MTVVKGNGHLFPHVRAMVVCIACGGPKREGLLICVECHNNLQMIYDQGYGPIMDRAIPKAEEVLNQVHKKIP